MPRVEVRILGRMSVLVDGAEKVVVARKHRSLIATLALRARPRSREQLIAELWPDSDEARGRESLRHALYRIRAAVGRELIASARDEVRIADDVEVDVRAFERAAAASSERDLARAIALYTGDLCPDVGGPDGEAERVRLRGLFSSAAERLASQTLARDPRAAADVASRVVEVDPFREEAHRLLLRALAAAGDRAAAATHYRRLTAVFRDELGIEPSHETKRLYASLLRQPDARGSTGARRPSTEPPAALIGRRDEYGRIMGLVAGTIDGRGGAVLVTGEAGAGKSRLLDEVAAVAQGHGMRLLRARATAAEGTLPYQLWVDALAGRAADAAALPPPWPAVLGTLLPEASLGEVGAVAPEMQRTRLFEGVARLLARIAAALPTVLVLDDLHHADEDSVQLWHYVGRTSRQRRLAMVAAARPPALGSLLAEAVASLEAGADLAVVPLAPLRPDAVLGLLEGFGVRREDAAWLSPRLTRWTGGNPFFVLEALRALVGLERLRRENDAWAWSGSRPAEDDPVADELPSTVRQTILARLGQLPRPTRRVLDLGAVLGPAMRIEVLASVAGRDEVLVAEEAAVAVDAGLLRETREGSVVSLAFAHELVRDAVYQETALGLRSAIHRRVAATLEREGAPGAAIAFHLSRGGEAVRAADHWIAAAVEAERRFAHDEAIRDYRAALEALGPSSPRRSELLMKTGDAEMRRGIGANAVAAYEDALASLPAPAAEERAALSVRVASAARLYQRHPRALELASAAVDHYRRRGSPEHLAEALVALSWVRYQGGDGPAARDLAEEAWAIARQAGLPRVEAEALRAAISARWQAGDVSAAPDPNDVERLASGIGDDEHVAALFVLAAIGLIRQGRVAESASAARRAREVARRVGNLRDELRAEEQLAGALLVAGSYREAAQSAEEVLREVAPPALDERDHLGGLLVEALALSGESARSRAMAQQVLDGMTADRPRPLHIGPELSAVRALMSVGERPDATLLEALRPTCRTCDISWSETAGRLSALAGDVEGALRLADELDERVRLTGYRLQAGAGDHVRGIAYARSGRTAEASQAVQRARSSFRAVGNAQAEAVLDRDLATITAAHA